MASTRTTFSLDEELAEQARTLGVNVSAAAREGVAAAVRSALAEADRRAYAKVPETLMSPGARPKRGALSEPG